MDGLPPVVGDRHFARGDGFYRLLCDSLELVGLRQSALRGYYRAIAAQIRHYSATIRPGCPQGSPSSEKLCLDS